MKESGGKMDKVALVMDLRGRDFFDSLFESLDDLSEKSWIAPQILFHKIRDPVPFAFFPIEFIPHTCLQRTCWSKRRREMRQQKKKEDETSPNYCLSDFVAPETLGKRDCMGTFVVSMGPEVDEVAKAYEKAGDDYNSIMVKALGDRFAEGLAELLHKRVRDIWGFGIDENLTQLEIIQEKYRGIRPAPGYPACPDHLEKKTLWRLMNAAASTEVTLTETLAMNPAASVCGYYFAHPESRYFNVGLVGRDQVEDYAQRRGEDLTYIEKWLGPNLDYEPES